MTWATSGRHRRGRDARSALASPGGRSARCAAARARATGSRRARSTTERCLRGADALLRSRRPARGTSRSSRACSKRPGHRRGGRGGARLGRHRARPGCDVRRRRARGGAVGAVELGGGPLVYKGPVAHNPLAIMRTVARRRRIRAVEAGHTTSSTRRHPPRSPGRRPCSSRPLRYMHSGVEVASLADVEALAALAEAFVRSLPVDLDLTR